jgi:hypothetical protein
MDVFENKRVNRKNGWIPESGRRVIQLASLKKNGAVQGTPEVERRNVNTRRPEVKRESVFLAVRSNVPHDGNERLARNGEAKAAYAGGFDGVRGYLRRLSSERRPAAVRDFRF